LSPLSLSPSELLTFKRQIMGNKKNKLVETLLDISTNPLFIIGVIASIAYPITSTKTMFEIAEGLKPVAAKVGPFMSYIHSAFTNLRQFNPLYQKLIGVSTESSLFIKEFGDKMSKILQGAGKMDGLNQAKLIGYVQGWNKGTGELGAIYKGIGNAPIMPNLRNQMSPELIAAGDKLRNMFEEVKGKFPEEMLDRIVTELDAKGIRIGRWIRDYFPHQARYDRFEEEAIKSLHTMSGKVGWGKQLESVIETKVSSFLKKRMGTAVPDWKIMEEATSAGLVRPDFVPTLRAEVNASIADAKATVGEILTGIVKNYPDLGDSAKTSFATAVKKALQDQKFNVSGRFGSAPTANMRLGMMAEHLFENMGTAQSLDDALTTVATAMASPPVYSMDVYKVLPNYLNSMASTYAWHGTKLGPQILGLTKEFTKAGWYGQRWARPYVEDQLIPLVRGLKTYKAFQRNIDWMDYKKTMVDLISKSPIGRVIPAQSKEWMLNFYNDFGPSLAIETVGGQISRWFQLSTLGLNVSSSIKNSLQPFLTTMPLFGATRMAKGMGVVASKLGQYASLRTGGMAHSDAFLQAFPDFVKALGAKSDIIRRMAAGDLMEETGMIPKGIKTTWEKIKEVAMTPFGAAETLNQLTTFYTAKGASLSEGYIGGLLKTSSAEAIEAAANRFGARAVEMTQFVGGPLGLPRALLDVWPPFRQFMHFPLRYMGFLAGSTRLGEQGINLGTLGRGLAASTAMYYGAKNLAGVDLSQGLMTGALPLPTYEKAPFYPFPFVPPVAGVAGSVVQALASGDTKSLTSAGALMVPGGVPGRRLYRNLSRKYADYKNRTPDGKIPVYNDQQALVGTFTPMQLTLKAIGLTPSSVAAEQGAAQWLLKQRDQIREYRRLYLQAITENDNNKAQSIQAEWKKRYPELGEIQVSKQDIKAVSNRREVARLERILRGLPAEYRPLFQQVAAGASLGQITPDLEQNPTVAEWYR
jgi:hypothetical protein